MVVFCNSTETNKSIANKKCPKNEKAFLRGDCPIYQGIRARGRDHLPRVWLWMWGVPWGWFICGVLPKIIWKLGQRMPGVAAVCAVGLCALTHTACPVCDWSHEAVHEKYGMRAPHKIGDCDHVILHSYMICFLITHNLFFIIISVLTLRYYRYIFFWKRLLKILFSIICKC